MTVVAGPDEFSKTVTKWKLEGEELKKVGSVEIKYESDIT